MPDLFRQDAWWVPFRSLQEVGRVDVQLSAPVADIRGPAFGTLGVGYKSYLILSLVTTAIISGN